MHNEYRQQSSLRHMLKSSICCFSGNFCAHHEALDGEELYYDELSPRKTPRTPLSPGSWLKKSGPVELGGRFRSRMSRMGRKHHRQSQSADFSYDPSSYALNFDDESRADDDEFPFRNFASRLRASPPTTPSPEYKNESPVPVTKEIIGYS